ncbi:MAG: 16S rRNA (guanine(966)-N(2))-methyltransferase RsmD [Deltaproteobacteria bacterium]
MRIVAGRWRGRTLRAPKGASVRPTLDRVREAVFDILGERVAGRTVLDLFAGTGAMGLEALSRDAASAVFVESDPRVFEVLRANMESLGAEGAEALLLDYRRALRALRARKRLFDLVFLDPPYGKGLGSAAARELVRAGLVAPGSVVVAEEAARAPEDPFPDGWEAAADRRYGDTRIRVYDVPAGASGPHVDEEIR